MPDFVLLGVRLPFLLLVLVLSGTVHLILDRLLAHFGGYAWVWHPGLFRVALFCSLFALTGLYFYA